MLKICKMRNATILQDSPSDASTGGRPYLNMYSKFRNSRPEPLVQSLSLFFILVFKDTINIPTNLPNMDKITFLVSRN